ncbi:CUB and sushi domain-containing protein 3-like isoform X3 [Acropora muricata]|uniref:CUB and sushi domain-containing protein 3-like isoform X3 n=1 Tax=Acropora muricata TaxID=159855 RepID=UPI0034E3DA33
MIWWASIVLTTAALVQTSLTDTIGLTRFAIQWPAGTYGIPKPKTGCPSSDGFQWMTGSRSQDTNNNESKNNKSASFHLDAVVDKKKVKRSFCLKTSTAKDQNRNIWPSGQYCIYKKGSCPHGLNDGFVYWDDDDNNNKNSKSGTLPDGCNKTLTAMNGTFHSPNYPNKHSDGEYCSWKISVIPGNRIRLTFSNPSFHKQDDASNLIVYDGENVSGEVLFHGSLPPPGKEFYSSSNHMLVVFESKATDSYTGFNASYNFIERRATDPIKWPAGTYGIPKPLSGCPVADGFEWMTGSRSQDTESNNNKSLSFHLDAVVNKKKVKRSFCLKTSTANDQNRTSWPSGQYCIYKKGNCPEHLNYGFVYWDDDDIYDNKNSKSGTLPDGVYNTDTEIEFCCRTDGNKDRPVALPTQEPFYLLAYKLPRCQMVKWAVSRLEWIYYDTDDWSNRDNRGGVFPYNAATQHPTIYYCYYRGCNKTLTAMNGTFHSPNYPNKHSDGEYCSWKISASPGNRIRLIVSNPSFHNQNDASKLIVYDGKNVSGEVLGVFHGNLPPTWKELYSSSNHMLVIFVSNATDSYTGFNASYSFIERRETPAPTISTTKQRPYVISWTYTENHLSTNGDLNEESGKNNQKGQSDEEAGANVAAIVVPLSGLVLVALLLVGVFFYCRRKRKRKGESGKPRDTVHFRTTGEETTLVENPTYDLTVNHSDMTRRGESNLTAHATTSTSENANQLYTEIEGREEQYIQTRETYPVQQNENPLYESAADKAVSNPLYDSNLITEMKKREAYLERQEENPLYEWSGSSS